MKKQVLKSHYNFDKYLSKGRWDSMWHQIDEALKLKPNNILEIGPGPGIFKAVGNALNLDIKTLDIDPDLRPDYLESVFEMPFEDNSFDVVCAFQMLEHLPYEDSLLAFKEMLRVAKKGVIISLPDAKNNWPIFFNLPRIGRIPIKILSLKFWLDKYIFDGEHYWEVNKRAYSLKKVIKDFCLFGWGLERTFRVVENPYHRFFVFLPRK